ncbi:helix-turn-helix domain-containing protein [Geothrix paludis]|uniref:helix-turn-helix domain-containing protein n=1 Tax=Geothrix paludis TaxID=2922722 RepID=UPI001FAC274D|nr:helix-turn-helix domain-containing protein [Geothrix paludis]
MGNEPKAQPAAPRAALTVEEAARSLGIGKVMLFKLLKEGQLRRVKIGRRTVIPAGDVEALVERLASLPKGE